MRTLFLVCICSVIFIFLGETSYAQENKDTLGYYLDRGAKQLKEEHVRKIYSGKTMRGTSITGESEFELTYNPDGTFEGNVKQTTSPYSSSRSRGTWTVDPDGKHCINETLVDWNIQLKNCLYFFYTGEAVFITKSNTDRDAKVYFRKRQ